MVVVALAFALLRLIHPLNSDYDVYVFFGLLALELPQYLRIWVHVRRW